MNDGHPTKSKNIILYVHENIILINFKAPWH